MYNIKTVVKLVGIPAVTIRAWENRYGVVEPSRTEGGHRLYTDRDVEDLRWLKRQIDEKGMSIGEAARMLKMSKAQQKEAEPAAESAPSDRDAFGQMKASLYESLIRFKAEEANSILDYGFALFHYEDMLHQVLVPLLYRVGDDWEKGIITVAQEHFISNLLNQRLHAFFRILPIHPDMPAVVAFCPAGEHHQLGLLLFALFLRKKGMDVLYLGADTPMDGVLQTIVDKQAKYVCVSLTGKRHLKTAVEMLEQIADRFPAIRIVLGGRAFAEGRHSFSDCVIGTTLPEWERWFAGKTGG